MTPRDDNTGGRAPTLRAVWRAFFDGATKPSAPAITGVLLVCGLFIAGCFTLLTPRVLADVDPGYIMDDDIDSYAYMAMRVFSYDKHGFESPSVMMFGSSSINQGTREVHEIEAQIEETLGRRVTFIPMYGETLSLWEMINIVGTLDTMPEGVIIIGVNIISFSQDPTRLDRVEELKRLPLLSDAYLAEFELFGLEPPRRTGIHFIDQGKFYSARIGSFKNVIRGPRTFKKRFDAAFVLPDPARWARAKAGLEGRLAEYKAHSSQGFEVLGRLLELIRSKTDAEILLVESPIHIGFRDEVDTEGMFPLHHQKMERFAAAREGVTYVDYSTPDVLDEEDFIDHIHLVESPSRHRWCGLVIDKACELLEAQGYGSTGGGE